MPLTIPSIYSAVSTGSITLVGVSATFLLVWLRALPRLWLKLWFNGTLAICGALMQIFAWGAGALRVLNVIKLPTYQSALRQFAAVVCHLHRRLCPHIKMTPADGSMDWSDIKGPHILMTNHTSFQDLLGGLWIVPMAYMAEMRIFYKASLVKLPVLGPLLKACGMFPVFYTSTNYDDFSVDRGKQNETLGDVEQYMQGGGSLMLAPEGVVNRTPRQLTEFRLGSFSIVTKYQRPLYYIVYCGHEEVWPPGAPIGGLPADVLFFIGKLELKDEEKEALMNDPKALSLKLKSVMQEKLDTLYAIKDSKKRLQ